MIAMVDIASKSRASVTVGRKVYLGVSGKLILNPSRSPKVLTKVCIGWVVNAVLTNGQAEVSIPCSGPVSESLGLTI